MQSHQDNSKYTQQYGKHRKVVKFSVAGLSGCVLLGVMLTLSAFSMTHKGVSTTSQAKPQLAVSANEQISHQIQTRKAVSSVAWRQFRQKRMSKPHKAAPQFSGVRAAKVVRPAPVVTTPVPVVTSTPAPVVTATVPTPTPVPTQPAATPPPGSGGGSIVSMIDQVFGASAPTAVQIATCESGLNPNAYNPASIGGSHAAGLFQILYPSTWYTTPQGQAGLSPYDAMANIQAAHSIFVRDGYSWREWVCQ